MCKLWSAKSDAPSHSFSLFTAQVAWQIGQVVSRAQSMRIGINWESTIDLRNTRSTIVTIYIYTPSKKNVKRSWSLDIGNSYVGNVQHVPLFLLEIPLIFFVTSFAPQNVQSSAMYPETRHGCASQAAPLKGQGLFQEQKTVTAPKLQARIVCVFPCEGLNKGFVVNHLILPDLECPGKKVCSWQKSLCPNALETNLLHQFIDFDGSINIHKHPSS
jgi:hypothetical protein